MKNSCPVGIFDSGVGGLTVLREVYRQLPGESIIYLGDTARLPYGNRSHSEILQFVREILTWMSQHPVKMVIMACNTSSALALETVRSEFDFPILGLILPGARAAVARGKRVGVIATSATVKSQAYSSSIKEIAPEAEVWEVPCPEFVPLIEQNRLGDTYTQEVTRQYLSSLIAAKIDTLIYGCTHYRHLESIIQKILPDSVQRIDPAEYVVKAAEQELELLGIKNTQSQPQTYFYVSGCPKQFATLSGQWLGFKPLVTQVSLPVVSLSPLQSGD